MIPKETEPTETKTPHWLNTPEGCTYNLTMFSHDGMGINDISLTREKFLELKRHLARIDGIDPNTAETEIAKKPKYFDA